MNKGKWYSLRDEFGSVCLRDLEDLALDLVLGDESLCYDYEYGKSIDENFENEDFKPYKKGIKNNSLGKYIELSFITPNIGRKYAEKIEKLSHATGWNIGISKSANMNEIINIASSLCTKKGIVLKKNPSFNSALLTVTLKLQNTKNINLESLKEEFETKTGCNIIFL
jgi:hypothetical protein